MKELRIFYDGTGKVVGTHGLEGGGDFPQPLADELKAYPIGTKALTITDATTITAFMTSDTSKVVNDKPVAGTPNIPSPIIPEPDYKALYAAATTQAAKTTIIAKMLGLL
jgi:hypothetical protein